MIEIFKINSEGSLQTTSMQERGISKVRRIIESADAPEHIATQFAIAEVRGKANGDTDIAECINDEGQTIHVAVPTGQRWIANWDHRP